jgi:cytochrome bd-type quinol oxidase subunit 2
MNNLGPFGLLAIAVGVAAVFVLVGAIPVLIARNLITRRPAATHLREWLLYVFSAALVIFAFAGCYLYGKHKGMAEYTVLKWLNILITTALVFGYAMKRFWPLRKKPRFWAVLGILFLSHLLVLSRLHWQGPGISGFPSLLALQNWRWLPHLHHEVRCLHSGNRPSGMRVA